MDIFNNPKTLKKLKGFSDLILEFNIEKYNLFKEMSEKYGWDNICLLYTSPSPRDRLLSRMPSSA